MNTTEIDPAHQHDEPAGDQIGVTSMLRQWSMALSATAHSLLALASAELRLAGFSLVLMLACTAGLAVFAASAWTGLVAGLVLLLLDAERVWWLAMFGVFASSLLAGLFCWIYMLYLSRNLEFSRTRSALYATTSPPDRED
ncbi:MAG: hypothetical protein PVG66_06570 [Chromatiales bacterium]|jgi:hypothetical protein